MRKAILSVAAGLAAVLSASSASAGTLYFQGGSTATPNGTTLISDFDTVTAGAFSNPNGNSGISPQAGIPNIAARPAFDSTGNFGYVGPGGSYSISFAAAQVFTFLLGSVDASNSLTLTFADLTTATFTGSQLVDNSSVNFGQQTGPTTNGRVTYDAQGVAGGAITGALFTTGVQAFEFDNIATAAPEPAAWLMMILGFGLVGGALRRARPGKALIAA